MLGAPLSSVALPCCCHAAPAPQAFLVEFEAAAVQHYRQQLLMDLVGMAEGALVVPLSAEAAVPKLQLSSPVLEYGECFLGHGYSRTIELLNDSKLPARFEVLDQVGVVAS